ncbi:hypothetical protein DPMN_014075 [Dreissena polymorpha]|uniref:Uncharacterized protein n=1 Tax=Dreissena polymorpha TaxID=45954 RepID=A0A9D4S4C0_DREPO|nr:hypothetical protein DPMN_014075 [Dreissena polymorpha]
MLIVEYMNLIINKTDLIYQLSKVLWQISLAHHTMVTVQDVVGHYIGENGQTGTVLS